VWPRSSAGPATGEMGFGEPLLGRGHLLTMSSHPPPGSALAYSAYVFPEEWVGSIFHCCYVPVAVLNTVLSTSLACYSRCVPSAVPPQLLQSNH